MKTIILFVNLILAVVLLELGSGLQGVLVPIRGELAGFSTTMLGGLGTTYYVGFVVGCLVLPRTIRQFGHIRCYSALAAIAACAALLHALVVGPWAWLAFRLCLGFCFSGLFMVIESWLNELTTTEIRGRVFSLYIVATWFGIIGGKLLFSIAPPDSFQLFSITSIAIALSLVPIALTTGAVPSIRRPERMRLTELYRIAPIGLVGCAAIGVANGAFWTFAPLFAQVRSNSSLGVSLFMSSCVAGSMIMQWPIGRFSDSVDRRQVILGVCLVSALAGLLLTLKNSASPILLLILAAVYGAFSLSIYSLCVAHANDRADSSAFVEVSSHLLLAFGVGAIIGPFLVSILISATGLANLFIFSACIHIGLAIFVVIRIRVLDPPSEAERILFAPQTPAAHGTQVIIELQPGIEQVEEKMDKQGHHESEADDE